MPLNIVRQDITRMDADAIVNAANTELRQGGGVCGAIFEAAGAQALQAACDALAPVPTGSAVITPGFALPARYIIHAVGPVYAPDNPEESARLLAAAYTAALTLAAERGLGSIAFPLISSGIYGYPKDRALQVATEAVKAFLEEHEMDICLVVFDKNSFAVSQTLLGSVESYIDETYAASRTVRRRPAKSAFNVLLLEDCAATDLEGYLAGMDEPFHTVLLRLIDAKGMTDVQVYKRANIDRKLFSKIRTGKGYVPGKRTVLALAVAMRLTLPETEALLARAGYALSHSNKFDVIVEYFIVTGQYDIFEINQALFAYDQPLLGAG